MPVVAILVIAFWIAFQFVQPAPPRKVVMAGGAEGGAYQDYALQYRDALKSNGIELELRRSAGSVENLKLLMDGNSGVSIGFVQGGIAKEGDDEDCDSRQHQAPEVAIAPGPDDGFGHPDHATLPAPDSSGERGGRSTGPGPSDQSFDAPSFIHWRMTLMVP